MGRRFWTSTAHAWRLARAAVLGLLAFFALNWVVDAWIAAVVAIAAAAVSLIDVALSSRGAGGH